MKKLFSFAILVILCSILFAQDEQQKQEQGDIMNWRQGIDLYQVTLWIQKHTGKKFLFVDESLKQRKIYFITDKDIQSNEDKFSVFQSMLQMSGFVLSKVGEGGAEIYKILPIEKGPNNYMEIRTGGEKVRIQDAYVTRIFKLNYIPARDVQTVLMNLVTQPKGLLPMESSRMILVSDYDSNIERFAKIIEAMDVKKPDAEKVQPKNSPDDALMPIAIIVAFIVLFFCIYISRGKTSR